jgi:hypothetical protein
MKDNTESFKNCRMPTELLLYRFEAAAVAEEKNTHEPGAQISSRKQ